MMAGKVIEVTDCTITITLVVRTVYHSTNVKATMNRAVGPSSKGGIYVTSNNDWICESRFRVEA